MEQSPAPEHHQPPESVAWMDAVALVVTNPGCTVGELVCFAGVEQAEPLALQTARLMLLPELHLAAAHGHLIAGPPRECRVRNMPTATWMPAENLAPQSLPVSGLRALEDLVGRAIHELQSVQALV
jgi:hypothetical protein